MFLTVQLTNRLLPIYPGKETDVTTLVPRSPQPRAASLQFHAWDECPIFVFVTRVALEGNLEHPCSLIGGTAYLTLELLELARHHVVL